VTFDAYAVQARVAAKINSVPKSSMSQLAVKALKRVSPIVSMTALAVLAAATALPALTGQDSEVSVVQQANQLARSGHAEEAAKLLQAALASRPADLDARLALAEIYARNGQDNKAEHEFREALRLRPSAPSAELALGVFYLNAGSLDAAEQVLNDAVGRHPKLTEARAQLTLVLARERKYAEADANIRLLPPPADASSRVRYFRLVASIHSGLGDSAGAAHAMEKALLAMPSDGELQLLASIAEAEAGEWQACLRNVAPLYERHAAPDSGLVLLRAQLASHAAFTSTLQSLRALSLPEDQKLQLRVRSAEILAAADKHQEAAEELQAALRIAGGGEVPLLYNLAVEQYGAGQYDAAFATLALLREQKDSAEVEDLLGDVEEQRGNRQAAVHSHQSAIAMAPEEERYRLSLGAELLKYGDYQPALLVFEQAAELFPASARIYVGLGMTDYFMEKYDESVSAFLRADKLDGGGARALTYLGATQVDNPAGPIPAAVEAICGRADSSSAESTAIQWCGALLFRKAYLAGNQAAAPDVIRRLHMVADLAPRDAAATCWLGRALEWAENLDQARHWLESCVRLRPNSAEDHYRLSRVYQALGLKQAAALQAELTDKANAERDQHQDMADTFAHDMLDRYKATESPK